MSGEIWSFDGQGRPSPCRSRLCEWCSKTEAIQMAFKVMKAEPGHQFTLTMIGNTPAEWLPKRKKFFRELRKVCSVDFWLAVEISPDHHLPHVHGFIRAEGRITQHQFQAAADRAGLGRSEIKPVPANRSRLAKHYAYALKSLDDPAIRDQFLRWNAKGSRLGFESHSRGFFVPPNEDDGVPLIQSEAFKERIRRARADDGSDEPTGRDAAGPGEPPDLAPEPSEVLGEADVSPNAPEKPTRRPIQWFFRSFDDRSNRIARLRPLKQVHYLKALRQIDSG